jgi:hypothetical protein
MIICDDMHNMDNIVEARVQQNACGSYDML